MIYGQTTAKILLLKLFVYKNNQNYYFHFRNIQIDSPVYLVVSASNW